MILHFEIKQTNNKPYISNQRALLRCDAGVGRDKSHLITTTSHLITTPRSIYLLLNAFLFYFNNSTVLAPKKKKKIASVAPLSKPHTMY